MKTQKKKKLINNLRVGTFVKCNGSILYVFESTNELINYPSDIGTLTIERHPEKSLTWLDFRTYSLIARPKKKHIDNAIKQIKDTYKFKCIDNLSYIENLNILKNYLKPVIVDEKD